MSLTRSLARSAAIARINAWSPVDQAISVARSRTSPRWSIMAAVSQLSAKYSSKAGCSATAAADSRSMTAWNSRTSRASIVARDPF